MGCAVLLAAGLLGIGNGYACSGNTISESGVPISPGCQRLDIIVHNMTQYTFVLDSSSVSSGANQHFSSSIPPETNGPTTLYIDGASAGDDVVNASIHYYATKEGVKKGPGMTLTLKKDACYSHNPEIVLNDDHCYSPYSISYPCPTADEPWKLCPYTTCQLDGSCDANSANCYACHYVCDMTSSVSSCAHVRSNLKCSFGLESDAVCVTDYRYDHVNCKGLDTTFSSSHVPSSVSVDPGLYTLGATLNSSGKNTEGDANTSVSYTPDAYFVCNQSSECGNDSNCSGGTSDYNRESKLEFYVYASPIETLTVTFPFNPQSPMGKIMRDVVHSHLDSTLVGLLGTYYSVNPVSVQGPSIAFSTLCNSDACPKPSS
jgi:hypothetical protein